MSYATLAPRVVVVSRRSELDELMDRHSTRGAAGYFLRQRGRSLDEVQARHDALAAALTEVGAAVPAHWRRGSVDRADLPSFLFSPEDIVIAVGQDGLVANVAKYLSGQPVIGVNPEPGRNAGVLVRVQSGQVNRLLPRVESRQAPTESRTMVQALLDDGQRLIGLNEVYIGHGSHQSARYSLSTPDGNGERHSSSGVIVGTGTGATGWLRSIARERAEPPEFPAPQERELCWFVREAWPSPATGASLTAGRIAAAEQLEIAVESDQLVCFADGIEPDHLTLSWGQRVVIGLAQQHLNLVTATLT